MQLASSSAVAAPQTGTRFQSTRVAAFKESVIREMTRLSVHYGAVNLAQGFPDFPAPSEIKEAARQAISNDTNQYSITWGAKRFREQIAEYYGSLYGLSVDPEREITVCCGATEGMIASLLALLNPGDEAIIFEPFYENYWPDAQLSGAVPRFVHLRPPVWSFEIDELRGAFSDRTRIVILNSPNNPTGHVFSREQLLTIGNLCQEFDCLIVTDEIYEHILYNDERHIPPITLPGLRDRCVLVNSLSKTYSVTGWRVGWVIAPPHLTASIRKVHDFLTVGAAAPLQEAGITALQMPREYYISLAHTYQQKRDLLLNILNTAGFRCFVPKGAYYIMCDISDLGRPHQRYLDAGLTDDVAFCRFLVEAVGVGAVPGSSFFLEPHDGAHLVRFCFAKRPETLHAAAERLARVRF